MRRLPFVLFVLIVAYAMVSIGCMDRKPAPVCPVPTELNETEARIGGFEGVDMLVVVDNSISMNEEQQVLATSFFPLVNSLASPLPGWAYPAADDVRVAVVTSDMGLSWGGHAYEEGDGWPGTNPCSASGDNGKFKTYADGTSIDIEEGVIKCGPGADAPQCPTGWTCENIDDETNIGECNDPDGDGTAQECPSMNATWAETSVESQNDNFNFQVACLSRQGTSGCGFEQQLQSAAAALSRSDQGAFIREKALLAVLVVSDEEDCSMEDGPSLFATDDIQGTGDGPSRLNVACGNHPEFLYPPSHYFTTYNNVKETSNAVIFAGIVGVPKGDTCEGTGDEISSCLDAEDMQLVEVVELNSAGQEAVYFRPACTREVGGEEVTKALPGIRYVELANEEFQRMSYIYSICNEDWSPAMEEISALIASNLAGTCYPKPLDWDPAERTAKCDVVVELLNQEECPSEFDDEDPVIVETEDEEGVEQTNVLCTLPKIKANRDCAAVDESALEDEFGWYYCENKSREDFADACSDDLDNDLDGDVDCDDSECEICQVCGGTDACGGLCRYMVQLTPEAESEVQGLAISVQCIQQFSFEDPNCQEDTAKSCDDGLDNDGNGVWDCEDDFEAETPHAADANCCPMVKCTQKMIDDAGNDDPCHGLSKGQCGIESRAAEICDFPDNGYPGACVAASSLLQCSLPTL